GEPENVPARDHGVRQSQHQRGPDPVRRLVHATSLTLALACQAQTRPREFPGERAFDYVRQQLDFGPRLPNTPGHDKTGHWILARLRATADSVAVQPIRHVTQQGATLRLRNLFARFRPELAERVLFLAHWDTRPKADQSQKQHALDRKSTRLNSSHVAISYAVFCLKKKKKYKK